MNIYLETLGCAKNQVDAEIMSRLLRDRAHRLVGAAEQADVAILNTCGFITSAKVEGIDRMLDLSDLKQKGALAYFVVTGCLGERYASDIYAEFPAVDLVLGVDEYGQIADRLETISQGLEKTLPARGDSIAHLDIEHESQNPYYAYLKIAEGCDQHCTYCAIPGIRGKQRSRTLEAILDEAKQHLARGVKELIVIAQDIASYGTDRYGRPRLADLITKLDALSGDFRFRLLYAYAYRLDDAVITAMARATHLVPYLDMPIQHMSAPVLKRMGRHESPAMIRQTVQKLRQAIPGITLRSTVMVAFPGETDDDFEILQNALAELAFERLGCFIFSAEEGTAAERLPDHLADEIGQDRYDRVMDAQTLRMAQQQEAKIGTIQNVLLEAFDDAELAFVGRSEADAPDVDPVVTVYVDDPDVALGHIVAVKIIAVDDTGLIGVNQHESTE